MTDKMDLSQLPPEDFMYDRVDNEFLVEVNIVLHFVKLAYDRLKENQSNHRVCETFIILKNLVNKHLPALNEKIVTSEQSQKDVDAIFKSNRHMMTKAVQNELEKTVNHPSLKGEACREICLG